MSTVNIPRQLLKLQEVDVELDAAEKAAARLTRQIDECEALTTARERLAAERQHLVELNKKQRFLELDVAELNSRLKKIEDELFSGRIRSQKELSALQHEDNTLKSNRGKLETEELKLMDMIEETGRNVKVAEVEFQAVNDGWEQEKGKLTAELDREKQIVSDLTEKRRQLASTLDPPVVNIYRDVKRTRGKAVVPLERGICTGCRIAVSVTDSQKVRSGQLVRCGSCGRILFQ